MYLLRNIAVVAFVVCAGVTLNAFAGLTARLDAGAPIVTYTGVATHFQGLAISPDGDLARFAWDFDGDGTMDWVSNTLASASHVFAAPGLYTAVFRAWTFAGEVAPSAGVEVTVLPGGGTPRTQPRQRFALLEPGAPLLPPDGYERRHALLINGADESRFWEDVLYIYDMLRQYNVPPEDIHVLHADGNDPQGNNPGGMIEASTRKTNLQAVCAKLAATVDGDDTLFVWLDGHGRGYTGPVQHNPGEARKIGYLDGEASVDPGDEQDYIERDFKLRSFYTGGDYAGNQGMNTWRVEARYKAPAAYNYCRTEYVSHFTNLYFAALGEFRSDNDVWIECITDYLAGDTNRDGALDTSQGERYDFDGDGVPPYDPATGAFDEDDWGAPDRLDDNFNYLNTVLPKGGYPYTLFDAGLDNRLDLCMAYDGTNLITHATDLDNAGLFDGADVNRDGDMDDWVSIDELLSLYWDPATDDELRSLLAPIHAGAMLIVAMPCFSGGYVAELSGNNRVVIAAAEEETVSWGNMFMRNVVSAFSGRNYPIGTGDSPAAADTDKDGCVNALEVFRFAAVTDTLPEIPQYDDNGDGVSTRDPGPEQADGAFGATVFLLSARTDADRDALPDRWEFTYFQSLTNTAGAGDSDGDGFPDRSECRAGTDPRSAASRLAMLTPERPLAGSGLVLRWTSVPNRTYRLLQSTHLPDRFPVCLASNLQGLASQTAYTDTNAAPALQRFFRVEVESN